jgi:hypothetical protein
MKNLGPLYVQEGFPMSSQSSLFDDLPRRRLWLLSKALEAVPLKEALQLAQAAQDFLDGASPSDVDLAISPRDPGRLALPHDDTAIPLAPADRLGEAAALPAIEPAPLPSGVARAETSDTQEAPFASTGLVVLAGPDDVVRYLRRADDVVVATDDGAYMVNGRFRESLEELVKRANRIRTRQRQPLFQLMPLCFARPAADRGKAQQPEGPEMTYGAEAVAAE